MCKMHIYLPLQLVKTMSISEFHDFSMSNWSKIQWFFHDFFIFTNFKNFSWNSMIFPWSWNRSEFQWIFKSCGNPGHDIITQDVNQTVGQQCVMCGLLASSDWKSFFISNISIEIIPRPNTPCLPKVNTAYHTEARFLILIVYNCVNTQDHLLEFIWK